MVKPSKKCRGIEYGGIAQLGERLNGIQEVSGSIPLISTKIKDSCSRKGHGSLIVITEGMSGYLIQIELAEKGCRAGSLVTVGQMDRRFIIFSSNLFPAHLSNIKNICYGYKEDAK